MNRFDKFTQKELEIMIDAIWLRQRCYIAGDVKFRECGELLDEAIANHPTYVPGKYR